MDPLRRAYSHWYQDGLGELVQAGIFATIGLYYFLVWRLPAGEPMALALPLLLPIVIIAVALGGRWLLRSLKERITFPRAGYVAYRKESVSRKVITRVLLGVTMGIAIQMTSIFVLDWGFDWVVFFMGLGFGLVYFYSGWRVGVWRLVVFGIIAVVGGSILAFTGWEDAALLAAFFFAFALLTFIVGLVTLVLFIRRNPLAGADALDYIGDPGEGAGGEEFADGE